MGLAVVTAGMSACHFILIAPIFFVAGGRGGAQKLTAAGVRTPGETTMTTPILRLIILDTETNGLPANKFAAPSVPGAWPAILQLSWKICNVLPDGSLKVRSDRDIGLALHSSERWNTEAAAVHGISEVEARYGTAPADALRELAAALRSVDLIVAHNLSFDKSVIRAAAWTEWERAGRPADTSLRDIWPSGPGAAADFCTMEATRAILRIPSPYYGPASGKLKAPRLGELYTWLHGSAYDVSGASLHSAKADTHCLMLCLSELLRRGLFVVRDGRIIVSASDDGLPESSC